MVWRSTQRRREDTGARRERGEDAGGGEALSRPPFTPPLNKALNDNHAAFPKHPPAIDQQAAQSSGTCSRDGQDD